MMDGGHMTSDDWLWMVALWFFLFWSTLGVLGVWAVRQWQATNVSVQP